MEEKRSKAESKNALNQCLLTGTILKNLPSLSFLKGLFAVLKVLSNSRVHRKTQRCRRFPSIIVLFLLALYSCIHEDRAEFVFVNGPEPESLDPACFSGIPEGRIASALFEGLTVLDPATLSPKEGTACRWEISSDQCTYRFFLRPQARWSNGEKVTSSDFVYAWKRMLSPETAAAFPDLLFLIRGARQYHLGRSKDPEPVGVSAADDSTLVVSLAHPSPCFLEICASFPFFPVLRSVVEQWGEKWILPGKMVSNGPYCLETWEVGRKIRMKKNPYYWDRENVKIPRLDALTIENPMTGFNLYETGGADYLPWEIPLNLKAHLYEESKMGKREDFHNFDTLGTFFLRVNVAKPFLNRPLLRQALGMAINRTELVRYVTRGGEKPAGTVVPRHLFPAYSPPLGMPFSPGKARELLARAGHPGGKGLPPLELLFSSSEANLHICEVLQEMWRQHLGVRVSLARQEWKACFSTVREGNYQIAVGSWIGDYLDPYNFLEIFCSGRKTNRTGWSSETYDSLLESAQGEREEGKRMALLRGAEEILLDEAPVIPLFFYTASALCREKVRGFFPNPRNFHPFKDLYLDRVR